MNLIFNQTYTFSYVETFLSKNGRTMFRVSLDGELYTVVARKYQVDNPPKEFVCRVKDIEENGYVRLSQEMAFILRDYYKPGEFYEFKVTGENPSVSGLPCYTLYNEDTELEHRYFGRDETDLLEVGSTIRRQTKVKEDKYGIPRLFFYQDDQDFALFSPEKVFSEISHGALVDTYFNDFIPETNELAVIYDDMIEKIETENRLWIFDYLKLLTHWSYVHPMENIQRTSDCNILIVEIENWIQNSGLLNKFGVDTREETLLKIKTTIRRALESLEILQAITDGTLDQTIQAILDSAKEKRPEASDAAFSKLIRLIYINPDVVETNFRAIAEFILLVSDRITDEDSLTMILKSFKRRIWTLKKQINASIHFQRSKELDREQLTDMALGLGALLYLLSGSIDTEKPALDFDSTFAEFCKYLSLLTDPGRADALIGKALEYVMGSTDSVEFDPVLLADIARDPAPFIDNLLQMPVVPDKMLRAAATSKCQMQYKDGRLVILPTESRIRALQPASPVYDIPGTLITVASGKAGAAPWETDEDLPYYDGCWDELEKWGIAEVLPEQDEDIIIRVKSSNTLPNYVFCSIEGHKGGGQDGVITKRGYLPHIYEDDPNLVFEAGMRFRCKFEQDSKGRISFSIADTLKKHSSQLARNSELKTHIGVCFSKRDRAAFFITTDGIVCGTLLTKWKTIKIAEGQAYILSLDPRKDTFGYPACTPIDFAECEETAAELLKRQLRAIAIPEEEKPSKEGSFKQMPHVLLIVDQYLRLASDDRTRYNLYRAMNLIAAAEGSQLVEYYRSRISYMEQLSAFAAGDKIDDSLDDPDITSRFPSLKEQEESLSVLSALGVEEDMDYLFNAAKRTDLDPNATKLARLVLASNLISQYDGPGELLDGLRKFIVSELGATSFIGSADDVMDYEEAEPEHEEKRVAYYGTENQTQEFKTSIVFSPETSLPDFDNQVNIIMRAICGFLNAKGGILWIGVSDSGYAHGIAADLKELNCGIDKYERILRQNIVNIFGKDVNGTIGVEFVKDGEFDICKVTIPSYPRPVAIHNEFFQRQGNETRIIKGNDLVLFVERKMMEKQPSAALAEKSPAGQPVQDVPVPEVPEEEPAAPEAAPAPSPTLSVWLNTFIDGTFVLSDSPVEDRRILYSVALPENDIDEYSLLLCYDDGTVNRVPVSSIVNKKRNYYYNNGVFKGASFMDALLAQDQLFLVLSSSGGTAACCPVEGIPAQTMLGMKGAAVTPSVPAGAAWSLSSAPEAVTESAAEPAVEEEPDPAEPASAREKILLWASQGRWAELRAWLEGIREEDVREVRQAVAEIYASRSFEDDSFWPLTLALLEGNAKLLRKPIADAVRSYSGCEGMVCTEEQINHAVELLLSDSDKVHQGMDFLIPFKSRLTSKAKETLVANAGYINSPEGFHTLFFLLGATFQEKLNVFEKLEDNLAAQFVTYEVLSNDEEENGIWHVQSAGNLDTILNAMKGSYGGNIVYNLIRKTVFHEDADLSDREAEELAAGGYDGLARMVALKEAQDRESQAIQDMPSYVGKELPFTVKKICRNHYFILHAGYRALLPIRYATSSYEEGDDLSATVVKCFPKNKLFLVTQKPATAGQLIAIPVVNVGDIVEVRFGISANSGVVVPSVQGYPYLRIEIVDYPRDFDYKKKYRAEVVGTHLTFCKLVLKESII